MLDHLQADIAKVSYQSEFFSEYVSKNAGLKTLGSDWEQPRVPFPRPDFATLVLDQFLRQNRNKEMARIIFRDQTRRADLIETTKDLSDLADESLALALDFHYQQLCEDWGTPLNEAGDPQQMCILALGKLGAYELNLSSDIDLVFFYESGGTLANGKSYQEFFLKLSRNLIRSLDVTTPDGFVFRVDMRLRPYGESGALVLTRPAMEKYYIEQGREWERYAFIKARAAVGDIAEGESFLRWLKPFVFRRHLDYGAVEALRDMKQLINQEVKRNALEDDVKLGAGGIREVEFIAQTQQLIWGGNRPELQQRRLLEVLELLKANDYLPEQDVEDLRSAYVFLRNSEHAIQAEKDQQTQKLPVDELGQARLASAMGFPSFEPFETALNKHRSHVSGMFAELMHANSSERDLILEGGLVWTSVWQDPESDSVLEHLTTGGFKDPEGTRKSLIELREELDDLQPIAEERHSKLLPLILRLVVREEDPDLTFKRCLGLLDVIQRRSTYVAFLNENLDALQRMIRLFSMSAFVADQVKSFPILLYDLTDWEVEQGIESKQSLEEDLLLDLKRTATSDLEARMDVLRTFKNSKALKVAMLELLDLLPTMKASDQLTYIAEIVLKHSVETAASYLIDRHGAPGTSEGEPDELKFAVIAYGKLGGYELGYGSDLDLVLLHDGASGGSTVGERSIHNNVFYSRLGQRLVHVLTSMTRFGVLYEVDLRLRPDGNSGPLVAALAGYAKYLESSAWTWELQALVRARFVTGSEELKTEFDDLRRRILGLPRETEQLKQDVIQMRENMRQHLEDDTQHSDEAEVLLSGFDLKHSVGAIVDIEFLVQYLVLKFSSERPELTVWTDKVRLLDSLSESSLMDEDEVEFLKEAYVAYRAAVHFTRLGGALSSYERLGDYRKRVVEIWQKYLQT